MEKRERKEKTSKGNILRKYMDAWMECVMKER